MVIDLVYNCILEEGVLSSHGIISSTMHSECSSIALSDWQLLNVAVCGTTSGPNGLCSHLLLYKEDPLVCSKVKQDIK